MTRTRCYACGNDWNATFRCCLSVETDPDDAMTITLCDQCWQSFERLATKDVQAQERRLLAEWTTAQQGAQP